MYHDISRINHSYWSYLHQLSYQTGAPSCIVGFIFPLWLVYTLWKPLLISLWTTITTIYSLLTIITTYNPIILPPLKHYCWSIGFPESPVEFSVLIPALGLVARSSNVADAAPRAWVVRNWAVDGVRHWRYCEMGGRLLLYDWYIVITYIYIVYIYTYIYIGCEYLIDGFNRWIQ